MTLMKSILGMLHTIRSNQTDSKRNNFYAFRMKKNYFEIGTKLNKKKRKIIEE